MKKTKAEINKEYFQRTKYKAINEYHKAKTKVYHMRVIFNTEQDIYQKLESVDNKSGYIKSLIRKDIEENDS